MKAALLSILLTVIFSAAVRSEEIASMPSRYFFSGDGHIHLATDKSNASYNGRYRNSTVEYDENAYRELCRVFGAPYDKRRIGLSMRLIEFLDYLQDQFGPGALVTITSGYRSPSYNSHLRNKGALAAKASLHQYGMAADLKIEGVAARRIWEFVKSLAFGGAGFYHGETVHIDVGPARSWDENSSGVGTGLSDDNKLIGLVTDYDRYRPGDTILLRFIRMTAFPVGVNTRFDLLAQSPSHPGTLVATFNPVSGMPTKEHCAHFENIEQMAVLRWPLPADISAGRYIIRAGFCENAWEAMPVEILAPSIEVVKH